MCCTFTGSSAELSVQQSRQDKCTKRRMSQQSLRYLPNCDCRQNALHVADLRAWSACSNVIDHVQCNNGLRALTRCNTAISQYFNHGSFSNMLRLSPEYHLPRHTTPSLQCHARDVAEPSNSPRRASAVRSLTLRKPFPAIIRVFCSCAHVCARITRIALKRSASVLCLHA